MEFIDKLNSEIATLADCYMHNCLDREGMLEKIQRRSTIVANYYSMQNDLAQQQANNAVLEAAKGLDFSNIDVNAIMKKFNLGGGK